MEITLALINNELLKIDQMINNIHVYYSNPLSASKEQILKETLQRRDDLLFERDKVLKINK